MANDLRDGARDSREQEIARDWEAYAERVRKRMQAGAEIEARLGKSIDRPALELLDEIQQELLDVSGWSSILWAKLEALRTELK